MKSLGRFILGACVAVILASPVVAQVSTFDLSGTVLDPSSALLPGATITLRNTKTGLVRTETADDRGRYHFIALPVVGEYSLKVELSGFAADERSGLVFQANTRPVIDVTLKLATLAEATTVTGAAPILETRKAELSLTVDQQKIETMPLNGRNYLDLANFAPGVHGAATRGDLSINGQLGRNIDYVVDGVSNKVIEWGDASKTGLSLDVLQEFQVITSQFSAEFGHALGGIVSAVTKSGTNDLHGTTYIYDRPGRLDADNPLTGTRAPFNQQQFGGVLSGPIVKNRTHFIASYEGMNQDSQLVVTSALQAGAFPATRNRTQGFSKATHRLTDSHNAQLRFNLDDDERIGGFGGLVLPDGGTKSSRSSWELQGTTTSVLSKQMVNEARFQYSQFVNESTNLAPGPRVIYNGFATYGANNNSPQDIRENRIQFNDKLSRDFGAHRTFVGVDMSHIAKTGVFNADAVGVYTFAAGTPYPFNAANPATFPQQFSQGFTDPRRPISLHRDFAPFDFAGIDRSYMNVDVFGQDDWEVRRGLTLNLGARYEKQTSSPDSNNIMPRTGFAWDLNTDGRTVVRGGYGRFYDQLFDNIPNTEDLFGITGNFSITMTPGGNPGVFPTFPAVFPSLPPGFSAALGRTVTLDLGALDPAARKTPYSDQVTLGVARELRSDLALTADYIYLRGRDLFRTIDLNGPTAFDTTTGATRTVPQADATRPYGSPSPGAGSVRHPGRRLQADPRHLFRGQQLVPGAEVQSDQALRAALLLPGVVHVLTGRERTGRFRVGRAGRGSVRLPARTRVERRAAHPDHQRDLRPAVRGVGVGDCGVQVGAAGRSAGRRRSQRRRLQHRSPRYARAQQLPAADLEDDRPRGGEDVRVRRIEPDRGPHGCLQSAECDQRHRGEHGLRPRVRHAGRDVHAADGGRQPAAVPVRGALSVLRRRDGRDRREGQDGFVVTHL